MKTNQKLMDEFSVEELECRLEMTAWITIKDCPGEQCSGGEQQE
ncbi:hypothetical protein SAMN06265349_10624 [Flavobacterium resistens]|uniref:Uncharacterized protein n=1 Tax=Flavobacterium resistens TaxID=443612 RepID=A0A521EZH1_9FLAO|nr:hypothetical protein SAMN06265349_10624 [Flavobacterium resistens]